jgi:hypothetical protein
MDQELKEKLTAKDKWTRLIVMIIYAVVNYFVQFLIWIIAAVQFIIALFLGKPNKNLLAFSEGLSGFSYHIMKYLMYNTEIKPYPFSPWSEIAKKPKPPKKPPEA